MKKLKVGDIVIAPKGCNYYLTLGKEYKIISLHGKMFEILNDEEHSTMCVLKCCAHIGGNDWIVKPKTYKKTMKRFELVANKTDFAPTKITTSKEAYDVIRMFYQSDIEIYESVFILLLNKANHTIAYAKISQGGTVGTVIDVKLIAKYIIDSLANGVIIAHNHPSGNTNPSEQDKQITTKIKDMCKLIDCNLLDHLILADSTFLSFSDEGLL